MKIAYTTHLTRYNGMTIGVEINTGCAWEKIARTSRKGVVEMRIAETLVLITKKDCANCEWVKSKIPKGLKIKMMDADNYVGMGFLAYYEALEFQVPLLIDERTDEVIQGTINIKNALLEAKNGE